MVRHRLSVSERRACRVLGQARSTHRHRAVVSDDEPRLVDRIIELATLYGRYGYRRITGLLRGEGWRVNHKRVERLWRREGLKVPQKQPKRGRLWLTDGSCIRCRPAYRHHVWAYDFVTARTHDGRPLKILAVVEEYSRECLALVVARRLRSIDVLETLAALFVTYGVPAHIRSDNGPEFTAELVRLWLDALDVETLFIEPGSPWENGYVESFNGKVRDELLDREIFFTLTEAQILIDRWRRDVQHGAAPQRTGLSSPSTGSDHPGSAWALKNESSSLITTGSTLGGRSLGRKTGQPITPSGFDKAWRRAREKAGCPDRIAHDFRRTAVRNLEQAGVPRSVAMKLTGHKTESVYRCYAIVTAGDLRSAARQLDAYTSAYTGVLSGDESGKKAQIP